MGGIFIFLREVYKVMYFNVFETSCGVFSEVRGRLVIFYQYCFMNFVLKSWLYLKHGTEMVDN